MSSPESPTEIHADYLGYVLFGIPPAVTALRYVGFPLNIFLLTPIFLALTVLTDAPRWGLPRWLWVPLMGFWPAALPAYGLIRRFNGARAHWSLGFLSIVAWYLLHGEMFQQGRAF
jgi:hypothetical protein